MLIRNGIRHRLVTVILLGAITSALSLIALVRVISLTTGQRVERGRAGVQAEVARLAAEGSGPEQDQHPSGLIGVRGGIARDVSPGGRAWLDRLAGVPADWRAKIVGCVSDASSAGNKITREFRLDSGVLVVSAEPSLSSLSSLSSFGSPSSSKKVIAWAGYLVPPPTWLRTWKTIVVALALATALLVTSAVLSVITVKRGATALNATLDALASDLNTAVPRPRLRELSEVADGIALLARRLARSREIQDDMGRELAQKDRLAALGRVVAGVAHEVRNPLASIKLRLDLARGELEGPSQGRFPIGGAAPLPHAVVDAIAHASGEITRLDRLVADLLVVANPGIGPRTQTALGQLVQARVASLAPWCDIRGVTLHVSGDAVASVDVDALARAIDNLLRNAVEASPAGGAVDVRVRQDSGADHDVVSIAIADRGPGIPTARTGELFEPFFTTKPDGTGLGLAICRSIARAHGGDVTLERRDNATIAELTLSRAPTTAGRDVVASSAPPAAPSRTPPSPGRHAV